MSRCLTRSVWIDGIHVNLATHPVRLADGTPVRLRSRGPGVHVRDLPGPVEVIIDTPAGAHRTVLDPAASFGRAGRTTQPSWSSPAQVYLGVQQTLGDPAAASALAHARADWVLDAVRASSPADTGAALAAVLGDVPPAQRQGLLAVIAAHPQLRDSEDVEPLVWQEISRWSLTRPSALLLHTLSEGTNTELLARIASANGDWGAEMLRLSHMWVAPRATQRLEQVWTEQLERLGPRWRVEVLDVLSRRTHMERATLLTAPAPVRELTSLVSEQYPGLHPVAMRAVSAAAGVEDVTHAALVGRYGSFSNLLSLAPLAAEHECAEALPALLEAVQSSPDLLEDQRELRTAVLTARFCRSLDEVIAVRESMTDEYVWSPQRALDGDLVCRATLMNPHLSADDRYRFLKRIEWEDNNDAGALPFGQFGYVARRLTCEGNTQAAYKMCMWVEFNPDDKELASAVASAWRTWTAPQQAKALQRRPRFLLGSLDAPADVSRARAIAAQIPDPVPAVRAFTATSSTELSAYLAATAAQRRWEAMPGVVANPDLDMAARAHALTSPQMTEAITDAFIDGPGMLAWGYGSTRFSAHVAQVARQLTAPNTFGMDVLTQAPPALVWLAAYTLVHDPERVETATRLAEDWHDTPAALAAAVESLMAM